MIAAKSRASALQVLQPLFSQPLFYPPLLSWQRPLLQCQLVLDVMKSDSHTSAEVPTVSCLQLKPWDCCRLALDQIGYSASTASSLGHSPRSILIAGSASGGQVKRQYIQLVTKGREHIAKKACALGGGAQQKARALKGFDHWVSLLAHGRVWRLHLPMVAGVRPAGVGEEAGAVCPRQLGRNACGTGRDPSRSR